MKFDNKGKERTDAYVGTFDTFCVEDMLVVETIKTYVKNMNKELANYGAVDKRGHELRFRACVKARKPINKVVNKYTGKRTGYTGHGDVIGGLANAAAVDVYVQRRSCY